MRVPLVASITGLVLAGVTPSALPSGSTHSVPAAVGHRLTTGVDLVRLANVFAGTDTALADQGTGGSAGNMSPAATAPFGMLSWGPRTVPDAVAFGAGYTYSDKTISGFDLTRFQGGGCAGFQDVPITPTTTAVTTSPASLLSGTFDPALDSSFDHRHESASPGTYSVVLNPGTRRAIDVKLAASTRAGIGAFRFPAGSTGTVVINAGGSADAVDTAGVRILPASRTVEITVANGRFCENPLGATLHVVIRFNRPFASHAVWQGESFHEGGTAATGHALVGIGYTPGFGGLPASLPGNPSGTAQAGAVLRFATAHHPRVTARVGLSYVSMHGARVALRREIAGSSLNEVRRATAARWARLLGKVRVAGGAQVDRRMLATTLYQSLLSPQVLGDIDGRFPGLDGRIHRAHGWTAYTQMSLWDEYRTHAQLLAMVAPRQARDMARSLLADERIAGFLPRWPAGASSPNVMVGDPAVPFLADLAAFGVRGFSRQAALAAAVHGARSNGLDDEKLGDAVVAATQGPIMIGRGTYTERPANAFYQRLHYVPIELDTTTNTTGGIELFLSQQVVWGSASTSLEYATADFATSQLAAATGHCATAREFLGRAGWWRESFDDATGYVEPRSLTGVFLPIGRTGQAHGFVEGDGSQYTFMVPFDVAGLAKSLGGPKALVARLDALFTRLNAGPNSPNAFLGNEPQLDTPYEYLWAGRPDRAEVVVHRALDSMYAPTPGGYPGNIDGGTMTSWWIWNAIGLYPAIPGDDVLTVGAPRFSRVVINLPGGKSLRVEAPAGSRAKPYVTSAALNGHRLDRAWVRYADLAKGATLHLTTSGQPGRWALSVAAAPPSYPASSRPRCAS
jgi:predicted alpha-1,2-mannosidase